MVRLQKVNFHIDNIYNLDLDFLQSLERKYILIDLDNTLDAYNVLVPAKRTYELLQEISSRFMIPIIMSNNKKKRVKSYCDHLRAKYYIYSSKKPSKKKIVNYLKSIGVEKGEEVIVIGDQLLTDAKLARNLGAMMILTEPLTKKEHWSAKFTRLIDRPLRHHYAKLNMLGRAANRK